MARPAHIPKFDDRVTAFADFARTRVEREVRAWAEVERSDFVDAIKHQFFRSFKAFPLSWATLDKKRRYRRGSRTMITTKEYINNIKVHVEPTRGKSWKMRYVIGIDESLPSRDITGKIRRDVTLQRVARIHEYGAPRAHIPARPHWGPWLLEMTERARGKRKQIARLVADDWNRKMGGVR